MKQCFIPIKASMGLLMLFCFFLVPGIAFAKADVSTVSLSSLEQIEPLVINGPEVSAALSAVLRDEAFEEASKQRAGAKYFGGITYGYSNELTFDTNEYKKKHSNLSFGLNFPLFGTFQKEKIGKLEAQTASIESKHNSNMILLNNLAELRKAYTTLWIEQQKEEVAQHFLNTEAETEHILLERQAQGLVLPVDRLEFLAVYYDVKRDMTASKLRQTKALKVITLATGIKWEMNEKLKAPSLPSIDGKKIDINNHPEMLFQNQLVSQYEKLLAEKKAIDRDGNLTIGLTGTREFPGSTISGGYIALSITEPFKAIGSKDQAKLAAAHDLKRAKEEEKSTRLKLDAQVEEALAAASHAAANVNAYEAHLIVMAESIREKMLRREVLPGDTFEQLQYSKSQYYRTAIEMLDQEEQFLQSAIEINSYVYPSGVVSESKERNLLINENDAVRNKLLAQNWLDSKSVQENMNVPLDFSNIRNLKITAVPFEPSVKPSDYSNVEKPTALLGTTKAAVYIWNAEPFLQSATRKSALDELIGAGFSRVLISFTHKQISDLLSQKGEDELNALLSAARSKGVRIDLMLGDPTWAEADHRGELIEIIKQLEKFDFDGIHLDIEPDSLPDASVRRAVLLEGLADTIKEVKKETVRPVSISIHPRYLEGDLGVLARQKLLPLGLEEIVVMIYSNNPYSTAQRMSGIISSNPNMALSLAQSVERNIPPEESYATCTQQELKDNLRVLEESLASYGLKEIFIQGWAEYKGEVR